MQHRARLALVAITLLLAGCKTWRVETGATPAEFVERERPDRIQVRRTDDTTLELFNASIVGDSIRGLPTELAIRPIMMPLTQVSAVATRHFSLGRTLLVTFAVAGGAFLYDQLMSLNEGF